MQKYKQNLNKINDILIKNSDMGYEMKNQITGIIKKAIQVQGGDIDYRLISKLVTDSLQQKFQGAWICIIGVKFVANIMHEPGHFLRGSNQKCHFVVFKLKEKNYESPVPLAQNKSQSKISMKEH